VQSPDPFPEEGIATQSIGAGGKKAFFFFCAPHHVWSRHYASTAVPGAETGRGLTARASRVRTRIDFLHDDVDREAEGAPRVPRGTRVGSNIVEIARGRLLLGGPVRSLAASIGRCGVTPRGGDRRELCSGQVLERNTLRRDLSEEDYESASKAKDRRVFASRVRIANGVGRPVTRPSKERSRASVATWHWLPDSRRVLDLSDQTTAGSSGPRPARGASTMTVIYLVRESSELHELTAFRSTER